MTIDPPLLFLAACGLSFAFGAVFGFVMRERPYL